MTAAASATASAAGLPRLRLRPPASATAGSARRPPRRSTSGAARRPRRDGASARGRRAPRRLALARSGWCPAASASWRGCLGRRVVGASASPRSSRRAGSVNGSRLLGCWLPPRTRQSPGRTPGLPGFGGRPCGWSGSTDSSVSGRARLCHPAGRAGDGLPHAARAQGDYDAPMPELPDLDILADAFHAALSGRPVTGSRRAPSRSWSAAPGRAGGARGPTPHIVRRTRQVPAF